MVPAFRPNLNSRGGSGLKPNVFTLHASWTSRGESWTFWKVRVFRPDLGLNSQEIKAFGLDLAPYRCSGFWSIFHALDNLGACWASFGPSLVSSSFGPKLGALGRTSGEFELDGLELACFSS